MVTMWKKIPIDNNLRLNLINISLTTFSKYKEVTLHLSRCKEDAEMAAKYLVRPEEAIGGMDVSPKSPFGEDISDSVRQRGIRCKWIKIIWMSFSPLNETDSSWEMTFVAIYLTMRIGAHAHCRQTVALQYLKQDLPRHLSYIGHLEHDKSQAYQCTNRKCI